MKKIDNLIPGELLCNPKFIHRDYLVGIGANPNNAIHMTKLAAHEPFFEVHRYRGMGNRVAITCGTHRAWLKMPVDIPVSLSKEYKFDHYAKEPVLSIFPVVVAALILWQRANAKTDLTGPDVYVDGESFDGILPVVVAAAMRGQVVLTDQMPRNGIYRSVANLLHVNVSTKQES